MYKSFINLMMDSSCSPPPVTIFEYLLNLSTSIFTNVLLLTSSFFILSLVHLLISSSVISFSLSILYFIYISILVYHTMIYNKGGRGEGENPMDKGKRRNEWGYIERE